MFWIILLIVGMVVFFILRSRSGSRPTSTLGQASVPATITITTSVSSGDEEPKVKVAWVSTETGTQLGSNLPLPLTLTNIDTLEARHIAEALESYDTFTLRGWLATLIARKNVRCVEIDAWAASAKRRFESTVAKAIEASPDWAAAAAPDREDLLAEFQATAAENLPVRPADVEVTIGLLTEEPSDLTVDDELLSRFSNRSDLYPVLLGALSYGNKVQVVPVGAYNRKNHEELASMGYLRRGTDIPLDDVLATLTLKVMNELAGNDAPKKLTRKAPAIEFLKTLPDLSDRLAKVVAFRELFQVAPIPGVDTDAIEASYHHSGLVAQVIVDTLKSGLSMARTLSKTEGYESEGYKIENWALYAEDCCPECKKLDGKTWKRLPQKLPPFHVGCNCELHWN